MQEVLSRALKIGAVGLKCRESATGLQGGQSWVLQRGLAGAGSQEVCLEVYLEKTATEPAELRRPAWPPRLMRDS